MWIAEQQLIHSSPGEIFYFGFLNGSKEEKHSHDDTYQIELFTSGSASSIEPRKKRILEPDHLHIVNASSPHKVEYRASNSVLFHISRIKMNQILNDLNGAKLIDPVFSESKALKLPVSLTSSLGHLAMMAKQASSDEIISSYLKEQYISIRNLILRTAVSSTAQLDWDAPISNQKALLDRTYAWLMDNLSDETIKLEDIAAVSGISIHHFVRMFKDHFGRTPIRFLQQLRIKRALEMISNPKLRLIDIAVACGFSNQKQFNRQFRAAVGVSPSEYRRRL